MKQALVEQGVYREQENSHLGWPDHTPVQRTFVDCLFGIYFFISPTVFDFFPLRDSSTLLSYTAGVEWTPYLAPVVDPDGLKPTNVSHSLGEATGSRMGILTVIGEEMPPFAGGSWEGGFLFPM